MVIWRNAAIGVRQRKELTTRPHNFVTHNGTPLIRYSFLYFFDSIKEDLIHSADAHLQGVLSACFRYEIDFLLHLLVYMQRTFLLNVFVATWLGQNFISS